MKKCVFSGGIINILYIAIKHECQKIFLRTKKKKKKTLQKMPSFFFRKLQLITVILLICDSYIS